MPSALARGPRSLMLNATLAYVVVYATWLLAHFGQDTRRFEDVAFLPLYAAAAFGIWSGVRAEGADGHARAAWRLIAAGWILSLVAALGWAAFPGQAAVDVVADALYNAYYPVLIAGFTLLCALPRSPRARLGLVLDTLIVIVACVTLSWYFVNEGTTYLSRLERFFGLGELTSVGELGVLVAASVALHGSRAGGRHRAVQLLSLGAFAAAVGDLMQGYLDPVREPEHRQMAAIILAGSVALFVAAGEANRGPERPNRLDAGVWLPYAATSVVGALVVRELLRQVPDVRLFTGLVLGGVFLTTIVLARLLLAERETREEQSARVEQDLRFRALIQRARESLVVVDAGGAVRFASPATEQVLGWDPERSVGMPFADLVAEGTARDLIEACGAPDDGRVVRWSRPTANGTRELETVIADLRDDPAVQGVVLNTSSVTDRVALEAQLRQSQKLDALGLLAGGLAHDFNNILGVVSGTAEMVISERIESPVEEMKEIRLASDRGAALCRQLLAFGRVDQARPEVLDVGGLARGVIPMLQRAVPFSVRLEAVHLGAEARFSGDRAQLEIALLNLVVNSRDALPSGGTIRITTGTDVVGRSAAGVGADGIPAGVYASVEVRDDGIGMDEATRVRALDPFFTTKPIGAGTGLGLSTVYGVVTGAGGHVRIRSAPGQGTAVTLLFPVVDRVATTPVTAQPAVASAAPGAVVLLVDDEIALRRTLARFLSAKGYVVLEAGDGVEAVARLDALTRPPDALISDIAMPLMNGVSLARLLRERHQDLPIILISGHAGAAAAGYQMPRGVDVMDKPFEFAQLESMLRRRMRPLS
ncbi:MAG: response regulator [Gemmatimonadetes bacterium]|nr:response regulator [Gemmatimonadota bacterium]